MTKDFSEYTDEFGFNAPSRADHGQRIPPPEDFRFGPEPGERFPDCRLKNASGNWVDLHQDRGVSKAAVMFYRSAVW